MTYLSSYNDNYQITPFMNVGDCLTLTNGNLPTLAFDTSAEGSDFIVATYDHDLYISGSYLVLSWTTSYWGYGYNDCGVIISLQETDYQHEYAKVSLYECP